MNDEIKDVTIEELLENDDIAYMGSVWIDDPTVTEGPFPGSRCTGEAPCINCGDIFFWGCSDGEFISEEQLPLYNKALKECNGNHDNAAALYCARIKKERPQGAYYSYIDKELWPLFNECGPKRNIEFGNPYEQGEYEIKEYKPQNSLIRKIKKFIGDII